MRGLGGYCGGAGGRLALFSTPLTLVVIGLVAPGLGPPELAY